MTQWKRPWCWERLRAGGEGDDREWDGWMASLTRWTQLWVNSGSWWWTGRPGVLQFMGSQRVGHNWGTELNWTELCLSGSNILSYLIPPFTACWLFWGIPRGQVAIFTFSSIELLLCLLIELFLPWEQRPLGRQRIRSWQQEAKNVTCGLLRIIASSATFISTLWLLDTWLLSIEETELYIGFWL